MRTKKTGWVELPEGIPIYSAAHMLYEWPRGRPETVHLYRDFDFWWVRTGQVQVRYRSGEVFRARPNEFLLMPPGVPFFAAEHRAPLSYYVCHFSFRPVPFGVNTQAAPDVTLPASQNFVPALFSSLEAPAVGRAFSDFIKRDRRCDGKPWRLEQALLRLVSELAAFGNARYAAAPAGQMVQPVADVDWRVSGIKKQISLQPGYPWKVADLARANHLSPGRLHFLFRQALGVSLKVYILEQRLRFALGLLSSHSGEAVSSIKDVSNACGYSSQNLFSRQFKAHYHMTPREYLRHGVQL